VTNTGNVNIPFSNKDKAPIKNLYQFKEYGWRKILIKFSKTNCIKGKTGHFTKKKFGKHEASTKGMISADRNTNVTEENMATVDELIAPVSQEGKNKHTVQLARYPKRWF